MNISPPLIFVSHSHKDNDFGMRLVKDLQSVLSNEDAVWYDSHGGLQGGDTWWETIIHEITTRSIFLVILSPDAVDSKWVNDEINLAWREKNSPRGMRLIPLLVRPCTIRADLRSLQVIDFQTSRDYDLAFGELLSAIGDIEPLTPQTPTSQPQRSHLSRVMQQAEEAFNARDWAAVIRKTDYLLKYASEDISANLYLWYGIALQQENKLKQAQGAFEMALVLVDDREQRLHILQSYTDLLISQERWNEVLPLTSEALQLNPNNPNWLLIQQRAQGQGKTKEEWQEIGTALKELKRYEEAIAAYDQAIRLDPNFTLAHNNKETALYDLKRYEEAASPVVPVSKIAHPSPQREVVPQSIHRNRFFPGRTAGLIGLVLLIIIGSVGLVFATLSHTPTASVKATLTAIANAQATAHTQATVRAAADAYAKYIATNGMMSGFNAQHTGVNPYEQILSPTTVSGLTKQWAYKTGGLVTSSPAVANGIVYVGSNDGNLYAIDATSGSKKWAYKMGDLVLSSPAVANGVVYVGSDDGNLYAFDLAKPSS